ncbi:MAG: hypothetical protein BWX71_02313 [Deltaproteobacteria bacterium ADurb.Bin072]|nr:MAG: hypothetical protein BWX71_02313 [Deltaproteobacteria bacterium ADurb.Bin072]
MPRSVPDITIRFMGVASASFLRATTRSSMTG